MNGLFQRSFSTEVSGGSNMDIQFMGTGSSIPQPSRGVSSLIFRYCGTWKLIGMDWIMR